MVGKRTFKQLSLIHIIICISTAILVGILYTLKNQDTLNQNSEDFLILEMIVPLLAVVTFAAAYFFGKMQYKKLDKSADLDTKFNAFRISNIVLWASLEGSAILGAVGFYLSGRMNLLLYSLMLGVLLIYFRPLKSRAVEFLQLSSEEADQLDDTI